MPTKVLEFVDAIKHFVKDNLERIHSCHIIYVYYSSIVKNCNFDTYEVVPLQIKIMDSHRDWLPIVLTFEQIVEIFNGKIPYLRVTDTKRKDRKLYAKGCTYLSITNNLQNYNGYDYYPHSTYCTNQVEFEALDKEVIAKVNEMKKEYRKKCRERDDAYSEVPLMS